MSLFQKHRKLFATWLVALIISFVLALLNQKGEMVLFFHQMRIDWLTELFELVTKLGETQGMILALLMVVLVGNYRNLLSLIVASLLMLLLVYILKHYAFPDAIRPIVLFEELGLDISYRPDYHLNRKHSFPSGHTTAAFVFFFCAAFATNRFTLKLLALFLAIGVAFSRVYLMQHFVLDTVAGSILGVIIATFISSIFERMTANRKGLSKKILSIHERKE